MNFQKGQLIRRFTGRKIQTIEYGKQYRFDGYSTRNGGYLYVLLPGTEVSAGPYLASSWEPAEPVKAVPKFTRKISMEATEKIKLLSDQLNEKTLFISQMLGEKEYNERRAENDILFLRRELDSVYIAIGKKIVSGEIVLKA